MEKIELNNGAYFLHVKSQQDHLKTILIVPNSAGYFANSPNYGNAGPRINKFCEDLAKFYNVYYLVLPGQDPNVSGKYGYTQSVAAAINAVNYLAARIQFAGFIGMCTGAAIIVEALADAGFSGFPLVIYNAAHKVSWNKPEGQKAFMEKYGATTYTGEKGIGPVTLDLDELIQNAPRTLTPIIAKHQGKTLQLVSGKSDYKTTLQLAVKIQGMQSKTFMTMSDAPIAESKEYPDLLNTIVNFFN